MTDNSDTVLTTPFFQIAIRNQGREIIISVHSDIKQSEHNDALLAYMNKLKAAGVTRYNVGHVYFPGCDRSLSLYRGTRKLDLVYEWQGRLRECELKTSRHLGDDVTYQHLKELTPKCQTLILLVPMNELENARQILVLTGLEKLIHIDHYDGEVRLT